MPRKKKSLPEPTLEDHRKMFNAKLTFLGNLLCDSAAKNTRIVRNLTPAIRAALEAHMNLPRPEQTIDVGERNYLALEIVHKLRR